VCVCVVNTAYTVDHDAQVQNTDKWNEDRTENEDTTKDKTVLVQLRKLPGGSWLPLFCQLVLSRSQRPHGLRRVSGSSLSGIVGLNLIGGMDVCLLWVLCVVRERSLSRAYHSSRGVPRIVL